MSWGEITTLKLLVIFISLLQNISVLFLVVVMAVVISSYIMRKAKYSFGAKKSKSIRSKTALHNYLRDHFPWRRELHLEIIIMLMGRKI